LYHTTAWLIWLLAGLVPALMIDNPLYLVLLLAVTVVNYKTLSRRSALTAAWQPLIKVALAVVVLTAVFNLLFAHQGRTVLFVLPSWQWLVGPDRRVALVNLGGSVALEAVVYGVTRAVGLITVILMFATFNIVVDTSRLMRSLPRFMYQTGVVASIAVSFVPQTMLALQEIREAQMVRGHEFRGIRDLLPLFMPLLTTGLERAVQLAESMEARGFGAQEQASRRDETLYKSGVAVALALLIAAAILFGFVYPLRWLALVLGGVALLLLTAVFRAMGRRIHRSRYVHELWRSRDTRLVVVSSASLLMVAAMSRFAVGFTQYYPYPQLRWPSFNALVGVALLMLVGPTVFLGEMKQRDKKGSPPDGIGRTESAAEARSPER